MPVGTKAQSVDLYTLYPTGPSWGIQAASLSFVSAAVQRFDRLKQILPAKRESRKRARHPISVPPALRAGTRKGKVRAISQDIKIVPEIFSPTRHYHLRFVTTPTLDIELKF